MKIRTGLENILENPPAWIRGRRLGLLCNQASVDSRLRHSKDLLHHALPGGLKCLFSPQHGLNAEKQDNMVESADEMDPVLNIPVFSLYGDSRDPGAEQLAGIDCLVVDLQDVGCRVYTYIWTLFLAMRACAGSGVSVAVLDRPNPLGGIQAEGNLLKSDCFSFVGMAPIPMRHGMTICELARYFLDFERLDLELHTVGMNGWERDMYFSSTGLPWVWPSPNMPTPDTAAVYPGQVILEGTNLSEGRGTTRPFEVFGAPYLDAGAVRGQLDRWGLAGFVLRDQFFEPTFHKWSGERCRGFQIHVTDRNTFLPYLTTLAILSAVRKSSPADFVWKDPPYEYEYERMPADLITGDRKLRDAVDAGAAPGDMQATWREELDGFLESRRQWLLYPAG